jgi:hypothetical protein
MSVKHLRGSRWTILAAAVAVGLILVGRGSARADDLDDFAARQKIAAQKALADIKSNLVQARKFEATDPEKARGFLRVAQFLLEDTQGLSERERADLTQQIQRGLRQVEAAVRERDRRANEDAERDSFKQKQEARKRELEMKAKYASGVGQANDFINTGKTVLGKYAELKLKRENNIVKMGLEDWETFSVMTEERWNKARQDWIARYRKTGQEMTQAEKDLLKMLNSTLSVDFKGHTLKQVIEYLQDKTDGKMSIFVDEQSLKEADVDYDSPVTFKAGKVTMRTVLKKVFADRGLTFIIKEAAIHVMTPAKAREYLVVRTYPVSDLLGTPNPQFGPYVNRVQQMRAAQALMQIIVNNVDPESWQVNGGKGSIVYEPNTMALIIRNTAEWHYQMTGALFK